MSTSHTGRSSKTTPTLTIAAVTIVGDRVGPQPAHHGHDLLADQEEHESLKEKSAGRQTALACRRLAPRGEAGRVVANHQPGDHDGQHPGDPQFLPEEVNGEGRGQ